VIHGDYEVHCTLIPYIKKICEEYEDTYRFNYGVSTSQLVRKFSVVRYNRYRTGQKIVSHYDHIHSIFDGKEQGIPILSLIGVFNDNYQGGKLTFWQNHEVELKQGDIVAFPSLFMYPHEVTEITEGTRYSWVSWCY
jgi:predicted 2-oxoglutarate/Fe(II)-dependent dioxygenase YbiX